MNYPIESIRPERTANGTRIAFFDFDGTVSLIRKGWREIMVDMMVGELLRLCTGESEPELRAMVRDYVGRLTGKPTIFQMIEFCRQKDARGGGSDDPQMWMDRFLGQLLPRVEERLDGLRRGTIAPDELLVPGTRALLESLRGRGLMQVLASGTEEDHIRMEAELLDVSKYFDGGMYGTPSDGRSFSKAELIETLKVREMIAGEQILGFGDGWTETANVHDAGGVTVGVASEELDCTRINEWKRGQLIAAGADFIVPNFERLPALLAVLFPN
jgi:phosphoglycolate phosphatase-like HAD superfamily hydrolase